MLKLLACKKIRRHLKHVLHTLILNGLFNSLGDFELLNLFEDKVKLTPHDIKVTSHNVQTPDMVYVIVPS